jgi:hypothetical protein
LAEWFFDGSAHVVGARTTNEAKRPNARAQLRSPICESFHGFPVWLIWL